MKKITVLIGSLKKESKNKKVVQFIEHALKDEFEFYYADLDLPLFSEDLESVYPQKVTELKNLIESSDGLLIFTPEYNRSFSGVLKNALDWASRPYGKNSLNGKLAVIGGVSIGHLGTSQAQAQLRNVLIALNTRLMNIPEAYINYHAVLDSDNIPMEFGQKFFREFSQSIKEHFTKN